MAMLDGTCFFAIGAAATVLITAFFKKKPYVPPYESAVRELAALQGEQGVLLVIRKELTQIGRAHV